MSEFTLEKAKKLGHDRDLGSNLNEELICQIVQATGVEGVIINRLVQFLENDAAKIHSLAHLFVEGIIMGYKFRQKEIEVEELERLNS